jgi:hypothetical protein
MANSKTKADARQGELLVCIFCIKIKGCVVVVRVFEKEKDRGMPLYLLGKRSYISCSAGWSRVAMMLFLHILHV